MIYPYHFAPEAQAEAEAAARWYANQRRSLGPEFLDALREGIRTITTVPESCSLLETWRGRGKIRRLILRRFPYAVVFEIVNGEIHIWAVAHTSRRSGYWASRRTSN